MPPQERQPVPSFWLAALIAMNSGNADRLLAALKCVRDRKLPVPDPVAFPPEVLEYFVEVLKPKGVSPHQLVIKHRRKGNPHSADSAAEACRRISEALAAGNIVPVIDALDINGPGSWHFHFKRRRAGGKSRPSDSLRTGAKFEGARAKGQSHKQAIWVVHVDEEAKQKRKVERTTITNAHAEIEGFLTRFEREKSGATPDEAKRRIDTRRFVARLVFAHKVLAKAKTIQQTKQVINIAAAAEVYARRQKLGEKAIAEATAIKTQALSLLDRMLKANAKE